MFLLLGDFRVLKSRWSKKWVALEELLCREQGRRELPSQSLTPERTLSKSPRWLPLEFDDPGGRRLESL